MSEPGLELRGRRSQEGLHWPGLRLLPGRKPLEDWRSGRRRGRPMERVRPEDRRKPVAGEKSGHEGGRQKGGATGPPALPLRDSSPTPLLPRSGPFPRAFRPGISLRRKIRSGPSFHSSFLFSHKRGSPVMIRIIREEYERRRWDIRGVKGSGGEEPRDPLRQPSKVSVASEVLRARTSFEGPEGNLWASWGSFTGGSPGGRVTSSTVTSD